MHTDTGKHAPGKRLRDNKSISRRHVRLGSRIEKTVARQRRRDDSRLSPGFLRTPTEIVESSSGFVIFRRRNPTYFRPCRFSFFFFFLQKKAGRLIDI